MAQALSPPSFEFDIDGGSANAARWTAWLRRFMIFLTAFGAKCVADVLQIAWLLHVGGEK